MPQACGVALALAALLAGCKPPQSVDRAAPAEAGAIPGGGDAKTIPPVPAPSTPDAAAPSPGPTTPLPLDAPAIQPDAPAAPDPPAPRPPFTDAVASTCSDAKPWAAGTMYQPGDVVTNGQPRRRFECKPWPFSPWCNLADYEPGKNVFYTDAWLDQGACP